MMDDIKIEHVGGVAWHQAPIPRRWHRCRAQTYGQHGCDQIERCACGATRLNGGIWMERNTR